MVHPTKWERSIGDKMNIDGKDYIVIEVGSRGQCIATINEEIEKINVVTREYNRRAREANKNRPLNEFEKTIIDIFNEIL